MSETQTKDKKPKYKLTGLALVASCILVLVTGFFGVQIWMEWDDQQRIELSHKATNPDKSKGAKSDVDTMIQKKSTPKEETVSVKKTDENALITELPGMEVYLLQVGSFSDVGGAQRMIASMRKLGFGSAEIPINKTHKVAVMLSFDKDQANTLQDYVESKKISVMSFDFKTDSRRLNLSSGSQRLAVFVDSRAAQFTGWIRELSDAYARYEATGFDANDFGSLVLKQKNLLADTRTELKNMEVSTSDSALRDGMDRFLQSYQSYLNRISASKVMDRPVLWSGLIQLVTEYQTIASGT